MSTESTELQHEITTANENAAYFLKASDAPITDAALYAGAADVLQSIKARAKQLDEREKAITRPINASLKAVRDLFRGPKDLLVQAESNLKRHMLSFQRVEEEKRLAAQRAAEELARKERERLARLAAQAEQRGAPEKAAEFAAREAAIVAPVIPVAQVKVAGIATRKDYTFEITDAAQLPREYLTADTVKIGKAVRALGNDANIPGVRVIEREILAARASA